MHPLLFYLCFFSIQIWHGGGRSVGKTWRYPICFAVTAVTGCFLWWLNERFPNPVTEVLAPNSGSPWEAGKLLFWPYIVGALLEWRMAGREGSRSGHCILLLLMPLLLMILRAGMPGQSIALLCALVLAGGMALYALVLRRRIWGGELLWYTLVILLGVAYLLFTALPPAGALFTDPADASVMATIPY